MTGYVLSAFPDVDFRKKIMKLGLAINDNDDPITEPVRPANGEHYDVIDEPLAERARPLRSAHRVRAARI